MKSLFLQSIIFVKYQLTLFKAWVIGVHDGDIITVLTSDNPQIKVRIKGIDCPELKQDFGQKAKRATSALHLGKDVRIKQAG